MHRWVRKGAWKFRWDVPLHSQRAQQGRIRDGYAVSRTGGDEHSNSTHVAAKACVLTQRAVPRNPLNMLTSLALHAPAAAGWEWITVEASYPQ